MTPILWLARRLGAAYSQIRGDATRDAELGARDLHLGENEATSFRARPGCVVACSRGIVLVTLEGDPKDHVLEAGDTFRVPKAGRLVAMALRDGVLRVGTAAECVTELTTGAAGA